MIQITDDLFIDSTEIREEFVRASGPGGQNVNKVASAVQLRFHVKNNRSLPADVRQRLIKLAGSALTKDGELILNSKRFRTQERNRKDAMEKLIHLSGRALYRVLMPGMHRSRRALGGHGRLPHSLCSHFP